MQFVKNSIFGSSKISESMFFVGVTGQLLTLILTVDLPFMSLSSDNGNVEFAQQTLQIEAHPVHSEVASADLVSFCNDQSITDVDKAFLVFHEFRAKCFLQKSFLGKWKTIFFRSSGNRAPPLIPFFT